MYDYSARHMEPAIGRFTTVDPHAEEFYAWSPYMYCYNNPVKFIDPDGEAPMGGLGWPPFDPAYYRQAKASHYVDKQIREGGHVLQGKALSVTDLNDATVIVISITRGKDAINIDGSKATTVDKVAAGFGAFLPFVSGSTIVKGFKKVASFLGLGGDAVKGARTFTQTAKEGSLEFYSTKIGDEIIEFGGEMSKTKDVLTIKGF